MKCEYCVRKFVEDDNIISSYLMHLIITHGDEIE